MSCTDDECEAIHHEGEFKPNPYPMPSDGGGTIMVDTLPQVGQANTLYLLVDDVQHPTEVTGVYTYAAGQWIIAAQAVAESIQIVDELPEEGEEGVLYYVRKEPGEDEFDLYRWVNEQWIKTDTDIKLYSSTGQNTDGSMTQKAITDALGGKQDTIDATHKLDADLVDDSASTNKFTNATEKSKLAGIAAGAQVNTLESVTVNNTAITPDENKNVNIVVPVSAAEVHALPDSTKYGNRIEASINSSTYVMTLTLKDQDGNTMGNAQTIDLPLESMVVSGSYDAQNKKVVLTLQSGQTVEFSVADLVSGLQTEITSSNKLDADLVDDSTSTNKFTNATEKSKLAGIENGAQVNAIASVSVNGHTITPDANKNVEITLPIINGGSTAPTTSTAAPVGTLYIYVDAQHDAHLYVCTEIDDTDPEDIIYTWTEQGGN